MLFSLKWGILDEKTRDFRLNARFRSENAWFSVKRGILEDENAWFSLKWGISEEKTRDFQLNGGF